MTSTTEQLETIIKHQHAITTLLHTIMLKSLICLDPQLKALANDPEILALQQTLDKLLEQTETLIERLPKQ